VFSKAKSGGRIPQVASTTEKPTYFEVRRILKARINAEKLGEIKEKLAHYGTAEPESES
jgi:hypothetical protein